MVSAETTKKKKTTTTKKRTPKKVVKSETMDAKFEKFKKKYNKHYQTPEEEQEAKNNFIKAEKNNQAHNQRKNETYKRETMAESDKPYEWQVKNRMGAKRGVGRSSVASSQLPKSVSTRMGETIPDSVDWSPWCSPIKNQHVCGSCWAFATVGVLEYLMNVITGEFTVLSEQNLIDCSKNNTGCDGGWPTYAMEYIIESGIVSNKDYQYVAYQSECIASRFKTVLSINETYELEVKGDEEYMRYLVATYGPTIAVIWATDGFTQYKSGVFSQSDCPNDFESYNHAIVIVGYGTDNSTGIPIDYWLIRNSWSTTWGINGYGKIVRNENMCGIGNYAMLPSSSQIGQQKNKAKKMKTN